MKLFYLKKVILFFLIFFLPKFLYAQERIPIKILNSGHIILEAAVNGVQGDFILDTGAGITVLTKDFSEKISKIKKQPRIFTAFRATGERIDVDLYTIDNLTIGNFVKRNLTVTVINADILNCDGIISLVPFENQPFTLDLKNNWFILESRKSLLKRESYGKCIRLQLDQNRDISLDIFARFSLNDKKEVQFLLDSGAGKNSFWINSRYLAACDVDTLDTTRVEKIIRKSEFNKTVKTKFYRATVPELNLKDYSKIKTVNFSATFTSSLIYDGKVSTNWLGSPITFDLIDKQMIVEK